MAPTIVACGRVVSGRTHLDISKGAACRVPGWRCCVRPSLSTRAGRLQGHWALKTDLTHLLELLAGPGEADLESFDFAEPAAFGGFADSLVQVGNDLSQAHGLGGVWLQHRAAKTRLTEMILAGIAARPSSCCSPRVTEAFRHHRVRACRCESLDEGAHARAVVRLVRGMGVRQAGAGRGRGSRIVAAQVSSMRRRPHTSPQASLVGWPRRWSPSRC
jgi:hypothetical protein